MSAERRPKLPVPTQSSPDRPPMPSVLPEKPIPLYQELMAFVSTELLKQYEVHDDARELFGIPQEVSVGACIPHRNNQQRITAWTVELLVIEPPIYDPAHPDHTDMDRLAKLVGNFTQAKYGLRLIHQELIPHTNHDSQPQHTLKLTLSSSAHDFR